VTTPAGTFRALRIDGDDKIKAQFIGAAGAINGAVATGDGATVIAHTQTSGPHTGYGEVFSSFYYVPSMKCLAKMVEDTYNSENVRTNHQTDTLLSFKPAN
jgi:hypothetical protein